jgi:outer membrane protein OmpA-like peptidoglycan-associated protein
MKTVRLVTALLLAFTMLACASMQKQWGKGALFGAVVGAFAGGTAGGVAANNDAFNDNDDQTVGAAIGIGMLSGGVLGAVVGHILWDKEAPPPVEVARPAPPPAPKRPAPPMVVLTGANFAFDSAKLTAEGKAKLAETVSSLKASPNLRVSVQGHTDSLGSEAYNLLLSKRRAEAVKSELVAQGIAPDRIETSGFGEANPVADNGTEAGRAANRRVEVHKLP